MKPIHLFCFVLLFLTTTVTYAQDNSLKADPKMGKSKKEQLKEKKELDKIHEKDKSKLANQFSEKKQYKKDLKVKPANPTAKD
jgi:hypothetical protein